MSMYDSFPPTSGRPTRDYGPPPTTRGLDKVNNGEGVTRHRSMREPRRRSPPQNGTSDLYTSDDDRYAVPAPARSSTAPTQSRAYDHGYSARDRHDDPRISRRRSPVDEQLPDRGIPGRGFGVIPGANDYPGYSKAERSNRVPPLAGYLEAPAAVKDLHECVPDPDETDRRIDEQERPRKQAPRVRERDYDESRGYNTRDKRQDLSLIHI